MNVRKRSKAMGMPAGPAPRNTGTTAKPAESQAAPIKNAHNTPKGRGYARVRNAVSG